MNGNGSRSIVLALTAFACFADSRSALPAEPSSQAGVLTEIVVTASKRGEQSLLETPMAIQAITADDLQKQGVAQFDSYARSISGLAFEDQGPGDKKIVLRGLASTGAATTGLYLDDIVLTANNSQDGGGRQPDIRLVDMERIEILKGPQGTLYGASSMSGTVRQITNKPDPTAFSVAANAGLAGTEGGGADYTVDGMVNVPLVDGRLAFRAVAYQAEREGFIDDINLGIDGASTDEVTGGRAALRWAITDDATLDLMYLRQDTDTDGPAWYQPLFGEFVQANHTPMPWTESLDAYNAVINWNVARGTVTANASRMERDLYYQFDGARILCTLFGGPASDCKQMVTSPLIQSRRAGAFQPQARSITSSELRYASAWESRWQLVAGVFYDKEENDFTSKVQSVDAQQNPIPGQLFVNRVVENDVEHRALFGELSYDLTQALTITGGARTFRIQIDQLGQNLQTLFRPVAQPAVFTRSIEEDETYKFNVQYRFAPDRQLYFTYAEGFRSGGNNEPDFTTGTVLPPYGSDSLKSYEVGLKGRFLERALELDTALYVMDWSDLHARVSAQIAGSSFLIVGNVGSARIQGGELGLKAAPLRDRDVLIGLTATVLAAELTETTPNVGNDGDRVPNVPEFSANLYGEYGFGIGDWESILRAEFAYVGDSYSDFNATRPVYTRQGDYSLVNLRWNMARAPYRLAVYVENVFDELAWITTSIDSRRPLEAYPTRPRTYGVQLSYRF